MAQMKKLHLLVVDDDRRMAKTLVDILNVRGFQVEAARSGPEALEMVKEYHFDCVLTDIRMPEMNGVELYRAIQEVQPELPVAFMSAYAGDQLVQEGLQEGAIGILNKPLDFNLLLSFLSSLQDERPIVIVNDDAVFCKTLEDILQERGYNVAAVADPNDIEQAIDLDRQMVLLDMKLNGVSCLAVLSQIRAWYPHTPIVLVTGYKVEMTASIEAAIEIDAFTCMYKPVEIEELFQVINQIRQQKFGKLVNRF